MTSLFKRAQPALSFPFPLLRSATWEKCVATTLLCGALGIPARAETVSAEYHRPISVELLGYLDVHHHPTGSTFFVKVVNDWNGLGCFFRDGQILEGKVVLASLRGKRSNPSQLAVAFDKIPCLYNKVNIDLVVGAAFFDPSAHIPNASFPIMKSNMARTGSVNTIQRSFEVEGVQVASITGNRAKHPQVKPGDVVGIRGVSLRVGAGPGRSSVLESSTRDVWVDKEAVLFLVPSSIAFLHRASSNFEVNLSPEDTPATEPAGDRAVQGGIEAPATAAAAAAPPLEFLPCEPPACNVDLPANGAEHLGKATQSIAIRPFGYAPRPQQEIGELDNDDALVWLGSHQLMVAFNPHTLISRNSAESGATMRRIHAVVFDVSSEKVLSTADWDLPDRQPYLWQLSDNRVLVHVGDELRVLSEGMQVVTRIPLDGPLAFVRTSPNGELMAIAVIHERHSPEMHRKLREALDHDPDEDVQIRILDKNFQSVAQATSSREIMPPILLNEGQVRLLASPNSKYRLELVPLQGDSTTVARFSSACLPAVSSFGPDLLFVSTCALNSRIHEYRVVRSNGAVVLRGKSDPQNLAPGVLGNAQNFAVRVLHAKFALVDGADFHGSDLDYAEVRIYRSGDGGRVSVVHAAMPPPTREGFALSSDGSQLAILSDSRISLFSVP